MSQYRLTYQQLEAIRCRYSKQRAAHRLVSMRHNMTLYLECRLNIENHLCVTHHTRLKAYYRRAFLQAKKEA